MIDVELSSEEIDALRSALNDKKTAKFDSKLRFEGRRDESRPIRKWLYNIINQIPIHVLGPFS